MRADTDDGGERSLPMMKDKWQEICAHLEHAQGPLGSQLSALVLGVQNRVSCRRAITGLPLAGGNDPDPHQPRPVAGHYLYDTDERRTVTSAIPTVRRKMSTPCSSFSFRGPKTTSRTGFVAPSAQYLTAV